MAALDNIASELLKSANEADLIYKRTRDQAQRDKAVRLRRIVENLKAISAGGLTPTLDEVLTEGNVSTNTLNVGGITSDYFQLDTTATPTLAPGMFAWNDAFGTADLRLKGNNVTLQVGQEILARVVNKTGSDLLESQYKVVRVRIASEGGAQGQRLAVVLAQGNNDPDSVTTLGIVTENIANNEEGFITILGNVNNIDTTGTLQGETWVDGDVLYLSPTTPGGLTKVPPVSPNHTVTIGYVVYAHQNQGKIFVKVDNGYELDELHNVLITSPANNDLLQYDSAQQVWKNVASSVAVPTPTLAQVTTAGNTTTNNISVGSTFVVGDWTSRPTNVYVRAATGGAENRGYYIGYGSGNDGNGGSLTYNPTTNLLSLRSPYNSGTIALSLEGNTNSVQFHNTSGTVVSKFVSSTGNLLIGTTTDAGYKLDVNGTARVLSSSEAVFRVEHTNGNYVTTVLGNGSALAAGQVGMYLNGSGIWSASSNFFKTFSNNIRGQSSSQIFTVIGGYGASNIGNSIRLQSNTWDLGAFTATSGTQNTVLISGGQNERWQPSSGNATYNSLVVLPIINTTGTYAGIVRGIFYNPTLTSVTGTTHRAIETVTGDVIFGSTSGNVAIGTNSPTTYMTEQRILAISGGPGTQISMVGSRTTNDILGAFAFWNNTNRVADINSIRYNNDTSGAIRFRVADSGSLSEAARIVSNGNVLIGTTTDAGERLQVTGDVRITNGRYKLGGSQVGLYATTDLGLTVNTGSGNSFLGYYATGGTSYLGTTVTLGRLSSVNLNAVSDLQEMVRITGNYAPTSGTGLFTALQLSNTINQTGGANGITRGLYINPTLTSAFDYRAIETTAGNVVFNGGNVGIGTSNPLYKLHVTDSAGDIVYILASTGQSAIIGATGSGTNRMYIGYSPGAENISITSSGVVRLNSITSGNVLIGTTTDAGYKLDVAGTARVTDNAFFNKNIAVGSTTGGTDNLISLLGPSNGFFRVRSVSGAVYLGLGDTLNGSQGNMFGLTRAYLNEYGNTVNGIMSTDNIPYSIRFGAFGSSTEALRITTSQITSYLKFVTTGSITAASALAQGVYFNNTLVAAANNDVLVGLDINPTFTNGAFTGVSNIGLRVQSGKTIFGSTTQGQPSEHYFESAGTNPILVVRGITPSSSDIQRWYNNNNLLAYLNASGDFYAGRLRVSSSGPSYPGISFRSDSSAGIGYTSGITVITNNTERLRVFNTTGNVGINTTTDAGYKLDVNGTTRVKGTGTTNATTAFQVENANASGSMVVLDNGNVGIGTNAPETKLTIQTDNIGITQNDTTGFILQNITPATSISGSQYSPALLFASNGWKQNSPTASEKGTWRIHSLSFTSPSSLGQRINSNLDIDWKVNNETYTNILRIDKACAITSGIGSIRFNSGVNFGQNVNLTDSFRYYGWNAGSTNGGRTAFEFGTTVLASQNTANGSVILNRVPFSPTTGSTTFVSYEYSGTINQTGGANGITRGIYINPTITAAADFRAIETTVGNVLLCTTSGNVGVGITPIYKLDINGAVRFQSTGTSSVTHSFLFRNDNSAYGGFTIGSSGQSLSIQQASGYGYLTAAGFYIGSTNSSIWTNNGSILDIQNASGTTTYLRVANTTGNVLIGTTTDAGYKLDVNGSTRIKGTGTTDSTIALLVQNNTGRLLLQTDDGGFTRIGGPTARLYVGVESGGYAARLVVNGEGLFSSGGIGNAGGFYIDQGGTSSASRTIWYDGSGTPKNLITGNGDNYITSGNFGLGTTTPTDKFHIVDNTNGNKFARISAGGTDASAAWVAQNDQVDNVVYRVFGSAVTGSQMGQALARSASLIANLGGTGKFLIGSFSGTDLIFGTSDQARMRLVDATGNFLIGTMTDNGNKLTVSGDIDAQGYKVNNVLGYTGILNIPTNPPGQQNIDIQGGIVINIF